VRVPAYVFRGTMPRPHPPLSRAERTRGRGHHSKVRHQELRAYGVGKTTTCLSLAHALAECDRTVLLIDLNPQSNITISRGRTGIGELGDEVVGQLRIHSNRLWIRALCPRAGYDGAESVGSANKSRSNSSHVVVTGSPRLLLDLRRSARTFAPVMGSVQGPAGTSTIWKQ